MYWQFIWNNYKSPLISWLFRFVSLGHTLKLLEVWNVRAYKELEDYSVYRGVVRTLIFTFQYSGEDAPGTASSYMMQSNYDMDIYGEAPDKMTYTEQANKRSHCKRLTW